MKNDDVDDSFSQVVVTLLTLGVQGEVPGTVPYHKNSSSSSTVPCYKDDQY